MRYGRFSDGVPVNVGVNEPAAFWLGIRPDIAKLRSMSLAAKIFVSERYSEEVKPLTKAELRAEMNKLHETLRG